MPIRPVPRKISELGSGTVSVVGDEPAKQVGELPQAAPATCSPKSLMAVEVEDFECNRDFATTTWEAVRHPSVSIQTVT
jgi:hypothetical protein